MTKLNPLSWNSPIVDAGGRPTPDFMRKWQQQQRINDFPSISLPSSQILVGSAAGVAAPVPVSGDAAISNTGAVTVSKSGGVAFGTAAFQPTTAFDAAGAAAAAQTNAEGYTDGKVAPLLAKALASANLFVGNASGVAAAVAMSGDATINNAGTITVGVKGSWTPTLQFGGASTGITYSRQVGRYAKVGPLVIVTLGIILSSKGTSVGNAEISGLPFAQENSLATGALALGWENFNFSSGYNELYIAVDANAATAGLRQSGNNVAIAFVTDANFNATTAIVGSGVYIA